MRRPREAGRVVLARARGMVTYPAPFQLVATSKPCPCTAPSACTCTAPAQRRYQARLAGLGTRPAISLQLTAPGRDACAVGESSAQAAVRVARARTIAADRLRGDGYRVNADLPLTTLTGRHGLPRRTVAGLTRMVDTGAIGLTGYAGILQTAWTIGDLRGTERPDQDAIDTAIAFYLPGTAQPVPARPGQDEPRPA
ncbi:ATP-binding protein [Actinoplanes sp. NPDC026619]|uniref:magnesium chelatase subunit ChlI family protein n=1 Tax=Actinoplanes sp. NPDC026619 TaxID=3155798 RepID=UPI0033EBFFD7